MPGSDETAYPWLADGPDNGSNTERVDGAEASALDGVEAPVMADSTTSMTDSGKEPPVPFLQTLVDAMRKIAEQTRDDAMARLHASVAERSASVRSETEKRATELRDLANADLTAVAGWELGEVQRIRDEAAGKVSARNATLDAQLAANVAAGEGAMTAVQSRIDAFEAEMTSFFAQLNDINDPAALASALKRIPQAPSMTDATATPAGDTAPSPAAVAAEPEATPEPMPEPAVEPEPMPEPAVKPEPTTTPEVTSAIAVSAAPGPAPPADGVPGPEVVPQAGEAVVAAVAEPTVEAAAVEEPAVAAPAEADGEEATTQVLVTGLTSFGAITSFKQSLERVNGIVRVSLGLGTSGEFIFTAVHRAGFDVSAAIQTFEEAAQFVAANGQLRVTVGPKA